MATRDAEVLKVVLERVEAAKGPDRDLDADIAIALECPGWTARKGWVAKDNAYFLRGDPKFITANCHPARPITQSLDAVSALMERVLPGWDFHLYPEDGGYVAEMDWPKDARVGDAGYFGITGRGTMRALAILSGILEGKLALLQEAADVHG